MKKKMTKNTKMKPYTQEQIAYFQAQSDMGDGTIQDIQDIDYIDHLLGGVHNPYDGVDMDVGGQIQNLKAKHSNSIFYQILKTDGQRVGVLVW